MKKNLIGIGLYLGRFSLPALGIVVFVVFLLSNILGLPEILQILKK